jgi:hypothetical protein
MWIQKITTELIDKILFEIQREHRVQLIKDKILDPIINVTLSRLYPYILTTSIVFFLTFIIAVAILFVMVRK